MLSDTVVNLSAGLSSLSYLLPAKTSRNNLEFLEQSHNVIGVFTCQDNIL